MRLNAPKKLTWWIAVIIAILGLIGKLILIPVFTALSFWLVLAAALLMILATSMKGL